MEINKKLKNNTKKQVDKYLVEYKLNDIVISRIIDIIISIIGIIITIPVQIIVAILLFKIDGLPIIFRQKRIGKDGKLIDIYKFRTMRKDAEKQLKKNKKLYHKYIQNNYKLPEDEDPRILSIGRKLRKSSIDEIPQLYCILIGNMSIVGPRPIVKDELNRYNDFKKEFLSVKPGLTGLWQVVGRSEIEYPERKYLDIIYIRNKNILTDIKIILSTIKVVFKKSGAY